MISLENIAYIIEDIRNNMIKDYKYLMELQYIQMEQIFKVCEKEMLKVKDLFLKYVFKKH